MEDHEIFSKVTGGSDPAGSLGTKKEVSLPTNAPTRWGGKGEGQSNSI